MHAKFDSLNLVVPHDVNATTAPAPLLGLYVSTLKIVRLIRPILEYASTACNPFYLHHVIKLERFKEDLFELWAHCSAFRSWMFLLMIWCDNIWHLSSGSASWECGLGDPLQTPQLHFRLSRFSCQDRLQGYSNYPGQWISWLITTTGLIIFEVWTCGETSSPWQLRTCWGGLVLRQPWSWNTSLHKSPQFLLASTFPHIYDYCYTF